MGDQGDEGAGWPLVAGTVLGKYQVVRLLGEGGMGAVYEGVHVEIGKRVAIKAMNPKLAAVPEARARFVREAQLTSLIRHPHVVDVTDIESEGGQPFLVMEYLEGDDLAKHIRRRGPLPIEEVADLALPVLAAVGAAHDEGVVHRDLKPQNVFLAEMRDGTIWPTVLDFGISKAPPQLGDPITTAGGMLGSPSYFAPEQVNDAKAVSAASDQYALGLILYECVTGRLPYEGSSLASILEAILRGHYFPARTHRPDLPDGMQAIIARAMSIDPAARYPTVKDMGRALLPFASEKVRLVWENHFAGEAPGAGGPAADKPVVRRRVPVPVTAQTPAGAPVFLSVTASLAGGKAAAVAAPESSQAPLSIPRRFSGRWLFGGVVLATVSVLAALAFHDRGAAPRSAATSAAPEIEPAPPPPPRVAPRSPPVVRAAARQEVKTDDGRRAIAMPRRGRPARPLRFGPNRAPLIE